MYYYLFSYFRILKSQLSKNVLEENMTVPKPNLIPDIYALQQMKALQVANNPAFKALVDARGKSSTTYIS